MSIWNSINSQQQLNPSALPTFAGLLLSSNLDVASAMNFTLGASIGANTLTLGGSTSTVSAPGVTSLVQLNINPATNGGITLLGDTPVCSYTNNGSSSASGVIFESFTRRGIGPAHASDIVFQHSLYARNSSSSDVPIANCQCIATGITAGAQAGEWLWSTAVSGSLITQMTLASELFLYVDLDFSSANHTIGASLSSNTLTLAANSSTVTIPGAFTFGNNLDVTTAHNASIAASIGANTLTLGASSSTISVPGTVTTGQLNINNSSGSGLNMSGSLPVYTATNTGNNAQGVRFQTHKNRAGAAAQAGDISAQWQAYFTNSALTDFESAHIQFYALGVTAGSEASQIAFDTTVSGTLANRLLLDSKLTSQVDIDFNATNHALGASLGANTLTIAGTNSTTYIQGTTNIAAPLMIEGDLFPGTNSLSVSNTTVTNICSSSTSVSKNNGITLAALSGGYGYGFTFTKTGIYRVTYNVSYRPSSVAAGATAEIYLIENDGSGDVGDRLCYCDEQLNVSNNFPTSMGRTDTIRITDITKTYRFVTFQSSAATQILGMTSSSRQRNGFSIIRESDL